MRRLRQILLPLLSVYKESSGRSRLHTNRLVFSQYYQKDYYWPQAPTAVQIPWVQHTRVPTKLQMLGTKNSGTIPKTVVST